MYKITLFVYAAQRTTVLAFERSSNRVLLILLVC